MQKTAGLAGRIYICLFFSDSGAFLVSYGQAFERIFLVPEL
jgi:hypothetical protein